MNATASSMFKPASTSTLELIKDLNIRHQHTFLIPTRFISPESGQVGYLFNEYINWNRAESERKIYRTFFANSRLEALQGAMKIVRYHGHEEAAKSPGRILILDPSLELNYLVDPLGRGEEKACLPGIRVLPSSDEIASVIQQGQPPLAVVVCATQELSTTAISELFQQCRQRKIFTIFEQTDLEYTNPAPLLHALNPLPDIVVSGESITEHEIPGGAFSMTGELHAPWASVWNCFVHSSTYAGNRLALIKMRETFLQQVPMFRSHQELRNACAGIEEVDAERLSAFAKYINPGLVKLYALTGLDVNPVKAHGSELTVKTPDGGEHVVLDCVSGGGAVIRGHTPDDIVAEVLDRHDLQTDYWNILQKRLTALLSLPHAFPAVSGATAVDIGMSLALLANKDKTKVVTFTDNYAGKTLLSLIATEDEDVRTPFFPLYHDVEYIDRSAPDAKEQLSTVLTSGKVALVWFEIYQGATEEEIPSELLEIIATHRRQYGYFIAVDEILMGFYRTGTLFSHTGTAVSPDITTFSKALSDGTFPMGITLTSAEVYQKALENNADVVRYHEQAYKHQLGSHIASHCVEKLLAPGMEEHVRHIADILHQGLSEISQQSPFLQTIVGKGLSYRLCYKPESFFADLFWSSVCLSEANTFLFFDRCSPALTMTEEEARLLVENLKQVFCRGKMSVYGRFLSYLLKAIRSYVFS